MKRLYANWVEIQNLVKEALNDFKKAFDGIEGLSIVDTDINCVGITVLYKIQHADHVTYESMQYTYAYLIAAYRNTLNTKKST